MRTVKMTDLISISIERTKLILFQQMSLNKWLRLLFIAFMAGALSGGSGGGGGGGSPETDDAQAYQSPIKEEVPQIAYSSGGVAEAQTPLESPGEFYASEDQTLRDSGSDSADQNLAVGVIILIAVITIAISILFTWLGARFRFIWFNALINDAATIVEPFGRYKTEGNSLFKFFIVFGIAVLVYFGLLVGWGFMAANGLGAFDPNFDWSFGSIMNVFGLPAIIGVISLILIAIFAFFIDQFVVTIMAMDTSAFQPAWGKFFNIFKTNQKDFWIYLLAVIGCAIVTSILAFIIAIIIILCLLIVAAILFGLTYVLIVNLLNMKLLYVILAVIFGIPFLVGAFLILMCVGLPFAVFFRCLSFYFLTSLGCGYSPLKLAFPEGSPGSQ